MYTFAPKQDVLREKMTFFITRQDRHIQVLAADAMATTIIIQ